MEDPGDSMEEIYALPPKLKYTESWLKLKEKKGFTEYWTVLKGTYLFFFKDQNTHAKEQYVGYIGIEVQQTKCSKKSSKTDLEMIMGKKKFHLRASDEILRDRWVHAINLVNRADPPGPLPGDLDFTEVADSTPAPDKMKKRAHTVCIVSTPPPIANLGSDGRKIGCDTLPRRIQRDSHPKPDEVFEKEEGEQEDQEENQLYDPVFVFPSWYYQKMSRQEAEQIMFEQSPGSYLLRDSDKQKSLYTLTIKDIGAMKHHRIWVNVTNGECYFESSPKVRLPNLLQAIDSLMKNTYHYLTAQPVCIENRRSGDGEEEATHMAEISRLTIGSAPESDYLLPGNLSPESPSDPFSYSPRVQRQTSAPTSVNEKTNSLPARWHSQRQQPAYQNQTMKAPRITQRQGPSYENQVIIESKFNSRIGESYIDMENKIFEDHRTSEDNESVDAPPPLPVKKKSIQRTYQCDPIYENVPFVYYVREGSHYDSPAAFKDAQLYGSTTWT